MAALRPRTRDLNGVLLLDKPPGLSSNAALQRVRHSLGRPKAGHTGTLDPLATGLLPVCVGEATKFSHAMLHADKAYEAIVRFGYRSTTGDAEGKLERVAEPDFDRDRLLRAMASLTGDIDQKPPMYSALKKNGQPLYDLARQGIEIEREPRKVRVSSMTLLDQSEDTVRLSITCGKGTYIRVLAEDLGARLGCGGYLLALRRTEVGAFRVRDAVPLSILERESADAIAGRLLPVDTLLSSLPSLDVEQAAAERLTHGLLVDPGETLLEGMVRLYGPGGEFLGLGEVRAPRSLVPRRLMARPVEAVITP
ncbi:MAG: tRNA pseudouridine(55) synthase TruB [Burkholderiales bacterium]